MSTEQRNLGKYQLVERLAHGGMGEVWKALDTQLQRHVAIKLLRSDWMDDADFIARFEREAQLIASLHHPNIIKIHNFHISRPPESETTKIYMVMDYVEGQTLADYIRITSRQSIWPPAGDILHIFTGTSLALDYAHQRNMIHRDIKPANILLDQRTPTTRACGEPILTDFGIARLQGVSAGTVVGSVIGTPLYMAPEQAMGQYDDKRSDLYGLGIILYEMMTGVTPFRGDTQFAIIMQHLQETPTPPMLINPHIPQKVSEVILKSISKQPEERFPSASALTIALAQAFNMPIPAPLASPETPGAGKPPAISSSPTSPFKQSAPLLDTPTGRELHQTPRGQDSMAQARQAQSATPARKPYPNPVTPILTDDDNWAWLSSPAPSLTPSSTPSAAPPNLTPPPRPEAQQTGRGRPQRSMSQPANRMKRWQMILIALLLISLGSGLAAFFIISSHSTGSNDTTVVGQIRLSQSAATKGYDTLQIDLKNVPLPPANMAYFAWIETPGNESNAPHWQLQVNQGAIHAANLRDARFGDFLRPGAFFLITEEQLGTIPPVVPDITARIYYAQISSGAQPVFDVKHCPPIVTSNTCVP